MNPALAIRIAMLGSVLLFGGVTWALQQAGVERGASPSPATLVLVGRVVWVAALVGCALLFARGQRATRPAQLLNVSILAWALGELVALYGAAVFFLAGVETWYLLGLGFLVLTFLAFPAGRATGAEASGERRR